MLDFKSVIGFAIQAITFLVPAPNAAITKIVDLLKALQASPEMLAWLQALLTKQAAVPATALGEIQVDPNDPALQAAWNASPMLHRWGKDHGGGETPAGTEGIGLGGIATLISLLPTLMKLIPQIQQLMPVIQQIIDLFKNLQPAAAPTK